MASSNTPTGLKHRFHLVKSGIRTEVVSSFEQAREGYQAASPIKKTALAALAATSLAGAGYLGQKFGFSWMAAQGLSVVAYLSSLATVRGIGDTKAKTLALSGVAVLYAIPAALLGGWGYAIMALSGALRNAYFGIVPDDILDQNKRRLKLGLGFSGLTIGSTALLAATTTPLHLITLVSSLMGTAATVLSSESNKNNKDVLVRSLHAGGNTTNATYQLLFGGYVQSGLDAILAWNIGRAISRFDIPAIDHESRVLKGFQRCALGLKIAKNIPAPDMLDRSVTEGKKASWGTTPEQLLEDSALLAWAHPSVSEQVAKPVFETWRKSHLKFRTLDQLKDSFNQPFESHHQAESYLGSSYFSNIRRIWGESEGQEISI